MKFNRTWAMPSADTFNVTPIGEFVMSYLSKSKVSIDPFSRNNRWATYTNDLNPSTAAESHLEAEEFLKLLASKNIKTDLIIFDPPYSPRQISECYQKAGIECGMKETQNASLYARIRDCMQPLLNQNAVVLSFGWNSVGMGKNRGFAIEEILLVCHGGAHNDTICMAERRILTLL